MTRLIARIPLRVAPLVVAFAVAAFPSSGGQLIAADKPDAAAPSAANDGHQEDRTAIRTTLGAFVKAFEARDAKALAAHWTEEGEYRSEASGTIQGRKAIEAAFAAAFAATPEAKAEIHPEPLKFLSKTTAVGEGSVTVRRGAAESATTSHYKTLLVREDGQWRLAQLTESPDDKVRIADLEWLIGEWKSLPNQGAEIRTVYSWAPNRKFIQVQFSLKEKDLTLTGNQVLGVDPATGTIHSWTFEADGGVAEGDWTRDGDHWSIQVTGTLANGETLTETNVLRRINADTVTWQSVERQLGDNELADLPPVKVTRVKPQK